MSGGPFDFLNFLSGPDPAANPGGPTAGATGFGGLGGLGGILTPRRDGVDFGDMLSALGESMLTASDRRTPFAGFSAALQRRGDAKQKESKEQQAFQARKSVLMQMGKPEAEAETMARSGDAVDLWIKGEQMKRQQDYQSRVLAQGDSTSDIREYQFAKQQGYTGSFADWQTKKANASGLGMTPLFLRDNSGNIVPGQLSRDGSVVASRLPDGYTYAPNVQTIDTGTGTALVAKNGGQTIGTIAKDVAGKAAQEKIGEAQGNAIAGAPNQLEATNNALDIIGQIKNDPVRTSATGWQSNFPTFKGSKVADFENLVEQAKSGAFLTAIQQMRGLGALSEAEGKAATAAVNRMKIATSDEGFLKAVQDYEGIVRRAQAKAQTLMRQNPNGISAPQGQATQGTTRSGIGWSAQ